MFLRNALIFVVLTLFSLNVLAHLEPGKYEWFCKGKTFDDETWEMLVEFNIKTTLYAQNDSSNSKIYNAHNKSLVSLFVYNGEDVLLDSSEITSELKLVKIDDNMTYEFYSLNKAGAKTSRSYIAPSLKSQKESFSDFFEFKVVSAHGKFKRGQCQLTKF